jgi:O-antigen ligase
MTIALALLLAFAVLTSWIPARWPLAVLQCGSFALAILSARRIRPAPVALPIAGVILWALLQLAFGQSVYPRETWDAVLVWTTNAALFFAASRISAGFFLRSTVWFGALLSAAALLGFSPFPSRNHYAALIELLLPVALAAAIRNRWLGLAAGLMYASVIAGASRAGAVLVTAEVVVILGLAVHRGLLPARRMAAVIASLCIFTAAAGWTVLSSRWKEPAGYTIRVELLGSSLEMVRARPWMGFGLGTWSTAYPAYARYDDGTFVNQAHNDWVQWAAEGGIPLLALMGWIAWTAVRRGFVLLWPLGITAVFLHALVDYPFQKPALEAAVFTLMGVMSFVTKKTS